MLRFLSFIIFIVLFPGYNVLASDGEPRKKHLKIGGAVRFNIASENYELSNDALDTYMKLDTWFLSADAGYDNFDLSFQYRFYPGSKAHFIHHAYIGYTISNSWYTKLGVFQKPFGIAPSASHSWWFQLPYYMGLEDTYGTGIGAEYKTDKLSVDLAYFRQAAPKGFLSSDYEDNAVGNSRFSYAVVPTTGLVGKNRSNASIREMDQFNTRIRYQLNDIIEVGLSGQLGSIYNEVLNKRNWGLNWAVHSVLDYQRWNLKTEIIGYDYNARNDEGVSLDAVQMAAYGAAYDVASRGMVYTCGIAYTIPVNRKFVQSIQPYLDYSMLDKGTKGYSNTHHFVPGVLITSGPVYTYVDLAIGKNQPWLTSDFGNGLGEGSDDARWNSRFNINIGYYF